MKDILKAVYTRPDTYRGHSKINHHHWMVELRCYTCDNSIEREMGILINGKPVPDYYDVLEVNFKGEVTYRHHFTDRRKANEFIKNCLKKFPELKKTF